MAIIFAPVCHAFTYGPFVGYSGYQEYEVGEGIYFVAFHVQRGTDADGLELAWRARVSEICLARNSPFFMELKHSLESVTKGDKSSKRGDEIQGATEFRKTAGFIYMPIFIPSFGGGGLIESPTKQAHILCVTDANVVNEPNRLIDANKTLAEARLKKWFRRQ